MLRKPGALNEPRPAGRDDLPSAEPSTGAVVAGRGTFEPAGGWRGNHHNDVPIFIYSRREPGIDISQWPLVTYLKDVEAAITRARQAAADKNVLVHGAGPWGTMERKVTIRTVMAGGTRAEMWLLGVVSGSVLDVYERRCCPCGCRTLRGRRSRFRGGARRR